MAELEDAGFLVNRMVEIFEPGSCYAEQYDAAVVAVEADRKAVALRAKRELLDEIRADANARRNEQYSEALDEAFDRAWDKYQEKP